MSPMNRRRFAWIATGGLASATLVACGADNEEDLTPTQISGVVGAPPTLAPNATPFSSGGAGGGGEEAATPVEEEAAAGGGGGAQTHEVDMENDLVFHPEELTINVGDTVKWINHGAIQHTSTADPDEAMNADDVHLPDGAETWNSGLMSQGDEFTHTFTVAGDYTYFCIPHESAGMIGHITVQEGGGGGGEEAAPAEETEAPAEEGGTEEAAAGGGGGGQTHEVDMENDLVFHPEELTINVGDTIKWINNGAIVHTSTADPGEAMNPDEHVQLPDGAETWNSGNMNQGDEFTHTFTVAGDYTYFCIPHESAGMIGHITVQGG